MPRALRYVPLLALLPGCAASARVGAQSKVLRGDPTAEAQGIVSVGGSGERPGNAVFFPTLSLSGGVIPSTGRGTGAFEFGGDYAGTVSSQVSLRLGPRVGAAWGGQPGSYVGLRGGVVLALETPYLDHSYPVVALEALAAPGVGGDLAATFVGGIGLTFGYEHYGSFRVPSGRPARIGGHEVRAPLTHGHAWREGPRPRVRDAARGRAWLDDALQEHASITAFARVILQLAMCGAPRALISGAHRALHDEIRHARICFTLASGYLGEELDPGPLPPLELPRASLDELAAESYADGVLGEGRAARVAAARHRAEPDPIARRALAIIARDERRHAALAEHIVSWCLQPRAA